MKFGQVKLKLVIDTYSIKQPYLSHSQHLLIRRPDNSNFH